MLDTSKLTVNYNTILQCAPLHLWGMLSHLPSILSR